MGYEVTNGTHCSSNEAGRPLASARVRLALGIQLVEVQRRFSGARGSEQLAKVLASETSDGFPLVVVIVFLVVDIAAFLVSVNGAMASRTLN